MTEDLNYNLFSLLSHINYFFVQQFDQIFVKKIIILHNITEYHKQVYCNIIAYICEQLYDNIQLCVENNNISKVIIASIYILIITN